MQVASNDYIVDRILWYWANMYIHSIERGDAYDLTKKTVCILIADFDVQKLESIPNYRTDFKIREQRYTDVVLTEKLEIVIIELKKLENSTNLSEIEKELLTWCKFIKNPAIVEDSMKNNEGIKKAKEELDKLSQDSRERCLAELREKAIMDSIAIEKTGYNKGKEDEKIKITKRLLELNTDIDTISKATGLSVEEIKNIK